MSIVPVTLVAGWLDEAAARLGARVADATAGSALLHAGAADICVSDGVEIVGVEEEVAYRSPGCPCCAVRLDLVDRLGLLARRLHAPRRAVIVGSPGYDVVTVAVTLLEDPVLRRHCRLDGVVACVPGRALAAAVASGVEDPWPTPSLLDAVLLADVVWIADAAALTVDGIRQAAWVVRSVNPTAAIDATTLPDVSRMVGLRSWALEAAATHVERVERARHPAGAAAVPTGSTLLRTDRPLDPELLDRFLDELHGTTGARLLRLDGVVHLAGDERRHLVQGCRTSLRSRRGSRWSAGERRTSRLRIVGRDVDVDHLVGAFEACGA